MGEGEKTPQEAVQELLQRVLRGERIDMGELEMHLLGMGHTPGSAAVCVEAMRLLEQELTAPMPEEREGEDPAVHVGRMEERLAATERLKARLDELTEAMKDVYRREKGP